MAATVKQHLTSRELWLRALYMVLFAIAYSIAELVIVFLVLVQFILVLVSGRANENLLRFGSNLSTYVYQILAFVTFNSETRPFPFAEFPDEAPGDTVWRTGPADESSTDRGDLAEAPDEAPGDDVRRADAPDESPRDNMRRADAPDESPRDNMRRADAPDESPRS